MVSSETPKRPRRALLIATDQYNDEGFGELRAPEGDVDALAHVLSDPDIGGFDVRAALTNEPKDIVCEEIEDFFDVARKDDLLLLYISGHGVLSPDRRLYFATTNTKLKRLRATGLPASFIHEVMEHSRSRRIVLMLDCCHSGAFPQSAAKGTGTVDVGSRFDGQGCVTLSASTELEYAYEDHHLVETGAAGSLFTRMVVEGLKTGEADVDNDGKISIDELYDYVYDRVRDETRYQTPELTGQFRGDLLIAASPHLIAPLPEALLKELEEPIMSRRLGAADELARLLRGTDTGLARAAERELRKLAADDSRRVSSAAAAALQAPGVREATEEPPTTATTRDSSRKADTIQSEDKRLDALPRGRSHAPKEKAAGEPVGTAKEEVRVRDTPAPREGAAWGRVQNLIRRAEERRHLRRYDEAIALFDQALEQEADALEALAGRGQAYFALHRLAPAHADFDRAVELEPTYVPALVGRARVNAERYRVEQSRADAELALELDPTSSEAYLARAHARSSVPGREQEVLADLERALELDPVSAEALAGRAFCLAEGGQTKEALADATRALELDPESVEALVTRAVLRVESEAEASAADLELALEKDPRSPLGLMARGVIALGRDDYKAAKRDFDEVLKANPDCAPVLVWRAVANRLLERHPAAAKDAARAVELTPENPDARAMRGIVGKAEADSQTGALAKESYDAAIEDFDIALENPAGLNGALASAADVHVLRGQCRLARERIDEAMADFDAAFKADDQHLGALVARAEAALTRGDMQVALDDSMRAVKLAPESDRARAVHGYAIALKFAQEGADRAGGIIASQLERNKEILEGASFENGWNVGQREALAEQLTGTEVPIWLCRCKRKQDTIRQVALVVTSEKLIWCRRTMFGAGPETGFATWAAIDHFQDDPGGFTIEAPGSGVEVGFDGIQTGADLSGNGLELTDADLSALVGAFVDLHHRPD